MPDFTYFAYGSNMLLERLRAEERCPSARVICSGMAQDFAVCFAKRSKDGSGKATLVQRLGASAYGVLFAIDESERERLKKIEGAEIHYHSVDDFPVLDVRSRSEMRAMTFFASADYYAPDLRPFDWYHALVFAGAKQNALPEEYLRVLCEAEPVADPVEARPTRVEALRVLRQAGFGGMLGERSGRR